MGNMPENSYPLTPLQQGMVYHSLLAPQSGFYVEQMMGRLREELDVPCFKEAWRRIVGRHAVLRTRFELAGEAGFLQEPTADALPEWTEKDWSRLSGDAREQHWRRYLDEDRRRGFDFAKSPLMRLALFRLDADHYIFLWTFHHGLLDGRSLYRILNELFDSYEALRAGREYRSDASPPFSTFINWLATQDSSRAKAFWQDALKGFEAPVGLAVAPPSGKENSEAGDRGLREIRLSQQDTDRLRTFAAQNNVTLGTLIQAAWAALVVEVRGQGLVHPAVTHRDGVGYPIAPDDQLVAVHASVRPAPDRARRAMLEDHVVADDGRQRHIRVRRGHREADYAKCRYGRQAELCHCRLHTLDPGRRRGCWRFSGLLPYKSNERAQPLA